ncbi:MAG: hypothetical protein ISR65_20280 [Bacteriovoracaceae bacterium]|nr:hypothetical protein [Bacteriovoracaceae bacterium]
MSDELQSIDSKYKSLLDRFEPYVLSYPDNFSMFNMMPFGVEIPEENRLSCIDSKNAIFFNALQSLDKLTFGPVGMAMDKWIFFDCGEMPGGIFGLGIRPDKLDEDALWRYDLKDTKYTGLIPISMFIAIPMAKDKAWFGHNLCSANRFLGDKIPLSGLALLTKVLGVKTYKIEEMFGATQWNSGALNIHLQMADMEIVSSFTPAHSFNETITYRSRYLDEFLLKSLSGEKRVANSWDRLIISNDRDAIRELQYEIEDGKKFKIIGRPMMIDGETCIPIKETLTINLVATSQSEISNKRLHIDQFFSGQ